MVITIISPMVRIGITTFPKLAIKIGIKTTVKTNVAARSSRTTNGKYLIVFFDVSIN